MKFVHFAWSWILENWQGVIAATAVVVTVYQLMKQRRHDRLSVKPFMKFTFGIGPRGVEIGLANDGLGPALYKGLGLCFDEEPLPKNWNWNDLLNRLKIGEMLIHSFKSVTKCLPAGERVILCEFSSSTGISHQDVQVAFARHMIIEFQYSSMYEKTTMSTKIGLRKQVGDIKV